MPLPTKTSIDQLGLRLKRGDVTEDDLRLLDAFRREFSTAYEAVITTIRDTLGLEPTGRPAKSTTSIIEKLQRETIRLTQMQDIAGCRLVVPDPPGQNDVAVGLRTAFETIAVVDRRQRPSHGYRAVHLIVSLDGKPIEVQVRTILQHLWAELSEKLADTVDPSIKYGGGPEELRTLLSQYSHLVDELEAVELDPVGGREERVRNVKQQIRTLLENAIVGLSKTQRRGQ